MTCDYAKRIGVPVCCIRSVVAKLQQTAQIARKKGTEMIRTLASWLLLQIHNRYNTIHNLVDLIIIIIHS